MTISTSNRRWFLWGSVLLILAVWKIASVLIDRAIILPSPDATIKYTFLLLKEREVWLALFWTLKRTLTAFAINLVAAVLLGMAAGFYEPFKLFISPLVTVLRAVPTMGVILLSLIWFSSETAAVFVSSLIVFPILYQAVLGGMDGRDEKLGEMNRIFRIPPVRRFFHFILPSLKPHVLTGIVSALGLSLKVMISAEVLSQPDKGVGTMFQVERARLNTEGVFAWSLLVILMTAGLDKLLGLLQRKYALENKRTP
ncbi:MAG: ABC transporter permease subunit [Spirochaetales bacterium]|nr:ABC transporter permease subunit [Spirochaetales bacterium]